MTKRRGQKTSYAQAGEDLAVLEVFANERNGVFVEAGGFDGVTYSNTCLLEREFGWTGLLVEPIPELAAKCREARPNSTTAEVALAAEEGTLTLTVAVEAPEYSSVRGADHMSLRVAAGEVRNITVPARRLDDVLADAGIDRVDFLSLDVEDAEWDALRGFDLERYGVRAVLLERDHLELRVSKRLMRAGLTFHSRVGTNDLWVRENDPRARRRAMIGLCKIAAKPTAKYIARRSLAKIGVLDSVREMRARARS